MDDNQNRIIIFCQAPADVQYVLSLYEQYNKSQKISVFVINVEGLYHYYKSLNLNLHELVFIPFPKNVPLKDFVELYKIKKQLKQDYNQYFQNKQGQTVYFFSKYFDWLTAFFIYGMRSENKVIMIDYSLELLNSKETFGPIITYRKLLYKYLTSINFRFIQMQSTRVIEFPIEKYDIEKFKYDLAPNILSKYKVRTSTNNSKSVLLFENSQLIYDFFADYELSMISIVELFKKCGYKIYLKPHPRQGYSDFLKPYIDNLLPAGIPGEFFSADDFTIIAGADTTAIAYFAKDDPTKTVSLLELLNFKREDEKERFRQMQLKLSENKMHFAYNLNELYQIIS